MRGVRNTIIKQEIS